MNLRALFPRIQFPIEVCVLLYGNFPHLAERVLDSLYRTMPLGLFRLRIGLNAVGWQTASLAHAYVARHPDAIMIESAENLFKYPMMRRLFSEPPLPSAWTLWLDDDSYFTREDWWLHLAHQVENHPHVKMWGAVYEMRIGAEQVEKISREAWYGGKPLRGRMGDGSAMVSFPTGGFWMIETACLRALDWPNRSLYHNGGDYLLGEAMRQQEWALGNCQYGVVVNAEDRRSPDGVPAAY